MKDSIALHVFFFVVAVRGFSNIFEEDVSTDDILAPTVIVKDNNGNLIKVDQSIRNTEDTETSRKDIAKQVIFYLHTVKNPGLSEAQQLWVGDVKTLCQSYFDPSIPTRFVTHGWMNSPYSKSCVLVREAYLKHGKYNVIVVDWSKISINLYSIAARGVKNVAKYVAQMIDFLATQGVDTTTTYFIGHSMGGHVAGIAARLAESTVGYVISLDPAMPQFASAGPGERVAQGDAKFVQVIHTDAGGLGYIKPIGDVDFYPNGGTHQPGCNRIFQLLCSHLIVSEYFAESINSYIGFVGTKCENYSEYKNGSCQYNDRALMGGAEPTTRATGSYYLDTNSVPPYAKGSERNDYKYMCN